MHALRTAAMPAVHHPLVAQILEFGKSPACCCGWCCAEGTRFQAGCTACACGACGAKTAARQARHLDVYFPGYRETLGEDAVLAHFDHWLAAHDTNAARTQASEGNINSFLESLIALECGGRLADSDDEDPERIGALPHPHHLVHRHDAERLPRAFRCAQTMPAGAAARPTRRRARAAAAAPAAARGARRQPATRT